MVSRRKHTPEAIVHLLHKANLATYAQVLVGFAFGLSDLLQVRIVLRSAFGAHNVTIPFGSFLGVHVLQLQLEK